MKLSELTVGNSRVIGDPATEISGLGLRFAQGAGGRSFLFDGTGPGARPCTYRGRFEPWGARIGGAGMGMRWRRAPR